MLRRLKFFRDFSRAEIRELFRARQWHEYVDGEEIVKEGEMDERFYVMVAGECSVLRHGQPVGALGTGECFGEASYVPAAERQPDKLSRHRRCQAGT